MRLFAHLSVVLLFATSAGAAPPFRGSHAPVPAVLAERMRGHAWRPGCPVPIEELSYLRVSYYGYDGTIQEGELVVHRDLAPEVLGIFRELFERKFPIEKMRLIDAYDASDDASMADNNTSSFNCRFVAGKPGVFSKHSWGRAIDINPRTNPMLVGSAVFPPEGSGFADRKQKAAGMIRANDAVVRAFARKGWTWGGTWRTLKDYQHFEK